MSVPPIAAAVGDNPARTIRPFDSTSTSRASVFRHEPGEDRRSPIPHREVGRAVREQERDAGRGIARRLGDSRDDDPTGGIQRDGVCPDPGALLGKIGIAIPATPKLGSSPPLARIRTTAMRVLPGDSTVPATMMRPWESITQSAAPPVRPPGWKVMRPSPSNVGSRSPGTACAGSARKNRERRSPRAPVRGFMMAISFRSCGPDAGERIAVNAVEGDWGRPSLPKRPKVVRRTSGTSPRCARVVGNLLQAPREAGSVLAK